MRYLSLFKLLGKHYIISIEKKEGLCMSDKEMLLILERENRKLKEDNEPLQQIVLQMKSTLNSLIGHYITKSNAEL